jgi:hypothetical protein
MAEQHIPMKFINIGDDLEAGLWGKYICIKAANGDQIGTHIFLSEKSLLEALQIYKTQETT